MELIETGKIVNTHGIRGDMKIELWCDGFDVFSSFDTLYLPTGEGFVPYTLTKAEPYKQFALVHIEGIDDKTEAERHKGAIVYIHRSQMDLPEDRILIADIIGLSVIHAKTGQVYGVLSDVLDGAAQQLYVVKRPDGTVSYMPAIREFIDHIDRAGGIYITPPEGLLMRFDIMTLFPEMVMGVLTQSIIGRAVRKEILDIHAHNIRDYSKDKFRRVDDTPYGGGKGMLMCCQPIYDCYQHVKKEAGRAPYVLYASPQGKKFDQKTAKRLAQHSHIAILCGHYEGVDRRIVEEIVDEEISIGDYVLSGGELPACVIVDAVARMVKGVLPEASCYENESFYHGLLEEPQYTKPPVFHGRAVPEVLLSGNHKKMNQWRHEAALALTMRSRP